MIAVLSGFVVTVVVTKSGEGAFVVDLNLGGFAEADLRPGRFDLVATDGQHGGRQKVLQALDALSAVLRRSARAASSAFTLPTKAVRFLM